MNRESPASDLDTLQADRQDLLLGSLRERERELAEAYRIGRLGTWRWFIPTDTITWSEEVYRAYGRDPAVAPPGYLELKEMNTPESWERLSRAVERAIATGEPYELDQEIVLPDHSRRWLLARGEVAARERNGSVFELCGTIQDITERKITEQRLTRSEARYRSLVRASSDVVWISGPDGLPTEASPEWQAFTGQTAEQMRGYGWAGAIHPDDRQRGVPAWKRAIVRGSNFQIKLRLRRQDGVYRHTLIRAAPSRDASGQIVEWVGMHTDITEQVETEAALSDTQSRFQRLYDANILGIAYPDKYGAFFDGNDEFLRIVGYSREELRAGQVRWDNMTPPEYTAIDAKHIVEAAERGSCTPYEKEYIRRDGTRVPILCGYALLEGSTEDYIGFFTDLTVQKQAQQALRDREQRFRELAETLPELVWVTGVDGWNDYINERFVEYTGIPMGALKGMAQADVIHPEDREQVMAKWTRCVETGEPYVNNLRLRRHDGVYRYFLARAVPIRDDDGKLQRWLGTATDIHDQKLAEETLRRTEKLAATGRLAASIAHEINNPLAAVTNSLYLALQMEMSEGVRGYLELAEQELARVAQVTTQTLRFHRQPTAAAPADLSEIMDSAIGLFARRFSDLSIAVDRDYRSRERVLCYGDELRQVFANLLGNSLDATRRGGRIVVRVRAGCDWKQKDGRARRGVRVTLADTGQGIPAEVRPRLFEPFVSTKEATGTGLGLWVSDGIVRKHNGHIAVRSRTAPPAGTVFVLFLPFDPPFESASLA
jgi:PAS domain S-box-containing protein